MARRKIILPNWANTEDASKSVEMLNSAFEKLTQGELVINTEADNTLLTTLNENGVPVIFESSEMIDKRLEELFEKVNQHDNKDVLDSITSGRTDSWDKAESNAKTYTDQQIDFIVSGASEAFDTLKEVETWIYNHSGQADTIITSINAISGVAHSHENKKVIDSITEDQVNNWDNLQTWVTQQGYLTSVPSDYAKKSDIPSLNGFASETWVKEQGYLTEHQDISGLATKGEVSSVEAKIPSINGLASETWVKEQGYLTTVPSDYATTEYVTQKITEAKLEGEDIDLSGYATQIWVNQQGFLTSVPSDYAKKGDIPSRDGYATQTWVSNQGFLTAVPSEYVTETELSNKGYLTGIPSDYAKKSDIPSLEGYATQTWVNQQSYLTSIPSEYVTETELSNKGYLTSIPSDYAKKSDIPSVEGYATQTWVNQQGFLTGVPSDYAKKSDIPSLEGYAKTSDIPSLNGYATQTWVSNQGFLTSIPSDYAKKNDIPSLDGYATQTWVSNQGYLTTVPSDYAKKSDIPSLANVATSGDYNDLNNKPTLFSGDYNDLTNKPTIPSVDGFIKNISISTSDNTLYIVGSTSKSGFTTSLNTSPTDVYISGGEVYAASDERLKDFGVNVEVDFNKLFEIPKVYYSWKDDEEKRQMIGTSAQKLKEIYPELVSENEDGKMAVSYEKLSIIALAAVDKLHKENEELKDRLNRIEEKLGL